jgi:hypothetical protein
MPQVKCECGGSVTVQYQTVRPRQRIWDDAEEKMRERYGRGASLRAIKASLDSLLDSSSRIFRAKPRPRGVYAGTYSFMNPKESERYTSSV